MVLNNVSHENENVRGMATIGLQLLVQTQLSVDVVRHVLPNVVQVVFQLVDSIDNDSIVKTLEALIQIYPEQIVPHAIEAVTRLAEHWHRLVRKQK